MGVPFRYALLKSVQLGNVYHMTLWYLFHKSWTVRKRRPQLCMLSRLGAETQNFRFYTYKFGILESALYGLLLWILVSGLHKLNEWHSLWRPYSWRATFIRNSQNSSFISHYISCMFHMKYLYRISMCDAKKKKRTKKRLLPCWIWFWSVLLPKEKSVTAIILSNVFLNVILAVRNSEYLVQTMTYLG